MFAHATVVHHQPHPFVTVQTPKTMLSDTHAAVWQSLSSLCRGGAVAGDIFSDNVEISVFDTLFSLNQCRGSGGALHFRTPTSMTNCTLTANTALVNGGAVFADIGGFATMSNCTCSNNTAVSGGCWFGVGVGSSIDLQNTTFGSNSATCCYSNGYGYALSSSASLSAVQTCTDTDSITGESSATCCSQLEYSTGSSCEACLEGADCSALGSTLQTQKLLPGFWRSSTNTTDIRPCWYEPACSGSGSNVTDSVVAARKLVSSSEHRSADRYCSPGYTGPYCAVCAPGGSNSISYQCNPCTASTKKGVFAALGVVLFLIAIGSVFLIMELLGLLDHFDSSAATTNLATRCFKKLLELPWDKLRIPIVAFQIISQYVSITGILEMHSACSACSLVLRLGSDTPHSDRSLSCQSVSLQQHTRALDLGLEHHTRVLMSTRHTADAMTHSCADVTTDNASADTHPPLFVDTYANCLTCVALQLQRCQASIRLLITTLFPFAVVLLLLCTYGTVHRQNRVRDIPQCSSRLVVPVRSPKLDEALAKHYLVFLIMTFLLYSTVSTVVFQTFACDRVDQLSTESYLRADYSIQCYTDTHHAYMVYAWVMVIVYPLGTPALYAYLLWRNSRRLGSQNEAMRDAAVALRPTRFLWHSYTHKFYYWEVIECMRRLLLTGAIVFIYPGTNDQASVACVLAVVSIAVAAQCRPHADALDGNIYTVGGVVTFLSMFLSLAIKANLGEEASYSSNAFGALLIALNILLGIAGVAQMFLVTCSAYSEPLGPLQQLGISASKWRTASDRSLNSASGDREDASVEPVDAQVEAVKC
eukprot:15059-Heterococcus_DN1.PRE.2